MCGVHKSAFHTQTHYSRRILGTVSSCLTLPRIINLPTGKVRLHSLLLHFTAPHTPYRWQTWDPPHLRNTITALATAATHMGLHSIQFCKYCFINPTTLAIQIFFTKATRYEGRIILTFNFTDAYKSLDCVEMVHYKTAYDGC